MSSRTNLVTQELPIYKNPSLEPLTRKQLRLVNKNPGTLVAIAKGARMGVEECQYQFRNRRWNCPTRDDTQSGSMFGDIVKKGEWKPGNVDSLAQVAKALWSTSIKHQSGTTVIRRRSWRVQQFRIFNRPRSKGLSYMGALRVFIFCWMLSLDKMYNIIPTKMTNTL